MSTAADIQTQLEEAWEGAEQAAPQEGDTYIQRVERDTVTYMVGVAEYPIAEGRHRILERAKPKAPEWEAVVASYLMSASDKREVYYHRVDDFWESETFVSEGDDLVDPVPLVEMPDEDTLASVLLDVYLDEEDGWPGSQSLADAVLELLRGERKA